jgi:hypothetical protein
MYDNTNKGALWPAKESANENYPDFTGTLNVEGRDYYISAWQKEPSGKKPVFNLKITAVGQSKEVVSFDNTPEKPVASKATEIPQEVPGFDDDIPF